MIKNFIFDCGNVLIGFSREHLCDVFINGSKEDKELLKKVIYTDWHLQDEGMPSKIYYEKVKEKLPERLWQSAYNLIFNWKGETWPIKGMLELIIKLKEKGYKLILLSNMPDTFSYDHDDIESLKYFDYKFFSFIEGMSKPDIRFYKYAVDKCNLNPKECLFVDDNLENINAGKKAGLNVYQFNPNDPESFINYVNSIIEQ